MAAAHVLPQSSELGVPHAAAGPMQRRYDPYAVSLSALSLLPLPAADSPSLYGYCIQDNGGTILAVSSNDFCIIGSDTRQSEGYSIQSRYTPRIFPLTTNTCIAVTGFMGDANTFVQKLKQRIEVS